MVNLLMLCVVTLYNSSNINEVIDNRYQKVLHGMLKHVKTILLLLCSIVYMPQVRVSVGLTTTDVNDYLMNTCMHAQGVLGLAASMHSLRDHDA